jgi:hypothetical protein
MLRPSTSKKVYRKVKRTLLIDSRDRNPLQTQSNYTVTLPKIYESIYSVTLRSAEIPQSWYAFSSAAGNTSFVVTVNSTPTTITIPDGNYTASSLASALQSALVAVYGAGTFAVSHSSTTNMLTFTKSSGNFTFSFAAQVQSRAGIPVPSTATWWGLGYFMGFNKIDYTSNGSVLSSVFQVQLNPFNYILMELDFINKEDECSIDNRMSGRIDGAFAKIPTQPSTSGNVIFFREWCCPMNKSVMYPPMSQLRTLNIKFRFHDGTLINFNNADHSLTLEFELLESNFDEYSSLELAPL